VEIDDITVTVHCELPQLAKTFLGEERSAPEWKIRSAEFWLNGVAD